MSREAEDIFKEITGDNEEAYKFICLWSSYCHKFDDLVDKDVNFSTENLLELNRILLRLTTCKFYDDYRPTVMALQIMIGENYVASEKLRIAKKDLPSFQLGLFLSHCGNDMLRFVALVVGGENHLNYVSEKLRELTIKEHPEG